MKLRKEDKITTLNIPFKTSDKQEIDNLIDRRIFIFEQYDPIKHDGVRIFKSRFIREIVGLTGVITDLLKRYTRGR